MNKNSQIRRFYKFTLVHLIKSIFYRFKLGKLGKRTIIEKNVELLRFTRNIRLENILIKDHQRDTLIYVQDLKATIVNPESFKNRELSFKNIEIKNLSIIE